MLLCHIVDYIYDLYDEETLVRHIISNYNIVPVGYYDPFYDAASRNIMEVKKSGPANASVLIFHKRYVLGKWYKPNFYQSNHSESSKDLLNIKNSGKERNNFRKLKFIILFALKMSF